MGSRRRCCCGAVTTVCGIPCAACSGVHFTPIGSTTCGSGGSAATAVKYGSITDSNGTWPVILGARLFACAPNTFAFPVTTSTRSVRSPDDCTAANLVVPYTYVLVCNDDGTVSLELHATTVVCDGLDYFTGALGSRPDPDDVPVQTSTVTPSCGGGSMTATFTFSALSGGAAPPSTSASLTMALEVAGDVVCCVPCNLPRTDLTLTYFIDGVSSTSTLAYDSGAGTWSDGTNTLACGSGSAQFTDPRGTHVAYDNTTCDPLHMEFGYTSGGHIYRAWIDA